MASFDNINVKPELTKKRTYWYQILLTGFILYLATTGTLVLTGNYNMFPTVVLIGNFLVPVSFVAFFYEKRNKAKAHANMSSTSLCFFYGGVLGTIAAAILEPVFIHTLTFNTSFVVGIIEEFTKMIGVVLIARRRKHNSQIDGIILGAAAGMGFAAFESTGYAFTAFMDSGGSLSYTVYITLLRGVLSPVGHGTWTAILSSILFREAHSDRFNINLKVIGAYVFVVALHGLWDGLPMVISSIIPSLDSAFSAYILIGTIGITALFFQWRKVKTSS